MAHTEGGKASTENLAEETQTLDLVDSDFTSTITRVFKTWTMSTGFLQV